MYNVTISQIFADSTNTQEVVRIRQIFKEQKVKKGINTLLTNYQNLNHK